MIQLDLLAKRFLPQFAILIAATLYVYFSEVNVNQWLTQLVWLPHIGLVIAAAISIQFGRSRMMFNCLLLLTLLLHNQYGLSSSATEGMNGDFISIKPEVLFNALLISSCLILFDKDRGLTPTSMVGVLLVLGLSIVGLDAAFEWLALNPENALNTYLSFITSLSFVSLTPLALIIATVTVVTGSFKLLLLPSNTHSAMWSTLLCLVLLQNNPNTLLINALLFVLSVLYIISILIDSHNMAFRDELTGIPSRRALMQYVQTLGRKYVVVMSDIDHFKKFNDTYGHDVGDQVLKLVAAKLNNVTGGGKAFRYGGEEFTLIFPKKTIEEAMPHIEVLRQTIANYDIVLRGNDRPDNSKENREKSKAKKEKTVSVTVSLGVAEREKELTDFMAIMKRSDEALYRAKKAGRNCVKL